MGLRFVAFIGLAVALVIGCEGEGTEESPISGGSDCATAVEGQPCAIIQQSCAQSSCGPGLFCNNDGRWQFDPGAEDPCCGNPDPCCGSDDPFCGEEETCDPTCPSKLPVDGSSCDPCWDSESCGGWTMDLGMGCGDQPTTAYCDNRVWSVQVEECAGGGGMGAAGGSGGAGGTGGMGESGG